jgi:hypothetical protein
VVENLDEPSKTILGISSSKAESVSRGEVRQELVSSHLGVSLMRCRKTVCTQNTPAIQSGTEDLTKIREAHQREKAAGRYVWFLMPDLLLSHKTSTALHDKRRLRGWKLR